MPDARKRAGNPGQDEHPESPEDRKKRELEALQEAEDCVLGTLLRRNGCIAEVAGFLKPFHFSRGNTMVVYEAILELYAKAYQADSVAVAELLARNGTLSNAGGVPALARLLEKGHGEWNVVQWARIVWSYSVQRQLVFVGHKIIDIGSNRTGTAEEMLANAQKELFKLVDGGTTDETVDLNSCIDDAFDRIDRRAQSNTTVSGVATGFLDLDEILSGLQPSELTVLAARPSQGKTALGLAIARNIAVLDREPVLFVSLEQSSEELTDRLICCHAEVDSHKMRTNRLSSQDMDRIIKAAGEMRPAPLYIDDRPGQTLMQVASSCRRWKNKKKIAAVIVDYLQLINPDDPRMPRQEQVASISRGLKHLARELAVPILALCQLNRATEDGADKTPKLSNLRESGSIEADADTVILMHRPDYYQENTRPNECDLIIAKQRNGPTGTKTLVFTREYQRFANHAAGLPGVPANF